MDLNLVNTTLRTLGVPLTVQQRGQSLSARGTLPRADGTRAQIRIPLELKAVPTNLPEAQLRCVQLHTAIQAGTYPPDLPWTPKHTPPPRTDRSVLTCGAAILRLETHYWDTRPRTSAAKRTWDRLHLELRRLPEHGPCTLRQLTDTVTQSTTPGTRTRQECVKVYKRLARFLALPGDLGELDRLQGRYEPAPRDLPSDTTIEALLDALRPTKWGWCYAALATFGCRPAEVPSLVIHKDGTAQCLTVKRRNRAPAPRTCFALPRAWLDRYALGNIQIPGEIRWNHPEAYDSAAAKRFVDAWRHSRRARDIRAIFTPLAPELDLYDLRHRWAIRSIEAGKPLTLCARAMGHSAAVHEQTYHRHIQAEDLRRAMATESV